MTILAKGRIYGSNHTPLIDFACNGGVSIYGESNIFVIKISAISLTIVSLFG
ncbi:hypothetical protein SAMN06296036_1194 [Pseudobacteriovorax antillogorgiicola]|uniref:Uncharacterized protein n=1 Tax=Pseudobacteriovorax antillogorgiicola TaxID=1513793 RepID=A0A1Y6CD69_9BACT|nr:hypothetical protein EDD56_1193 [Pseudobacteriovorax antillogorgiicola]SMF57710.1 hypothetical protein SAMN06296036_1194 [Pseudobacteriovorax antillogorgiicola]